LVVGVLSQRMALIAIRVSDRVVLAKARSPKGGTVLQRARKAGQRLSGRLKKALQKKATPAPPPPTAEAQQPPIVAPPSLVASKPATSEDTAKADGMLYIHREQLEGVTSVSLDGEPVPFTGKGFVAWSTTSGLHQLRATHIDGRTLEKTVVIRSGQTTNFDLRFAPKAAVVADREAPSPEAVTERWWFWTAVGPAVLAGATTAAVLASGGKGGPTPPSESGSIQGTY
ncbi:MAG: hypothetical protein AAF449_20030, partial [Myxococcota bacterium]